EARLLGAVLQGPARNLVVVGLVGLTEVGGVGERNGAAAPHPVKRGAGVETAGKGNADLLAGRQRLQDVSHSLDGPVRVSTSSMASRLGPSIMMARASPIVSGPYSGFTFTQRSFAI